MWLAGKQHGTQGGRYVEGVTAFGGEERTRWSIRVMTSLSARASGIGSGWIVVAATGAVNDRRPIHGSQLGMHRSHLCHWNGLRMSSHM